VHHPETEQTLADTNDNREKPRALSTKCFIPASRRTSFDRCST